MSLAWNRSTSTADHSRSSRGDIPHSCNHRYCPHIHMDAIRALGCRLVGVSVRPLWGQCCSAKVMAADLERDPTDNARMIESRSHRGNAIPVRLDASKPLPFAEEYFDAILCANSLNFYGTDIAVLDRIARRLQRNGVFRSGGECLSDEFTPDQVAAPPDVYNFAKAVWEGDFLASHSPRWWADHIAASNELELVWCKELEDGRRFYEEQALLTEPRGYFGLSALAAREQQIRQIEFGRKNRPYMPVYQLVARRK